MKNVEIVKLLKYEPFTEWDKDASKEKINELYYQVLALIDDTINWYNSQRKAKGYWAKRIRIISIILLISSSLMPYISAVYDNKINILYIGYISAGLGGGLLLMDRYYGISSSWVRFVLTGKNLEDLRNNFVQNWQIVYIVNSPLTKDKFIALSAVINKFHNSFNEIVKSETKEWAVEFQQNFKELVSALEKQIRDSKSELETAKNASESDVEKVNELNTEKINTTQSDIDNVNLAIDQNRNFLYGKGNVRLITQGKKKNEVNSKLVNCVVIHLKDDNTTGMPKFLSAKSLNGDEITVETEIVESVNKPSISYNAGDSIANSISPNFKGSIGCRIRLKNGTQCLLTCSHVMTDGSAANLNGFFDNTVASRIADSSQGTWFFGLRDEEFDIALIKDFIPNSFSFPDGMKIRSARALHLDDVKKTKVRMIGRLDFYSQLPGKNVINGYVINHKCLNPIAIRYKDGDFSLMNLILISKTKTQPYQAISSPGDSGSLIVDEDNLAIGIVIAQNSNFTYAMSFAKVSSKILAEIDA